MVHHRSPSIYDSFSCSGVLPQLAATKRISEHYNAPIISSVTQLNGRGGALDNLTRLEWNDEDPSSLTLGEHSGLVQGVGDLGWRRGFKAIGGPEIGCTFHVATDSSQRFQKTQTSSLQLPDRRSQLAPASNRYRRHGPQLSVLTTGSFPFP